jgi:hypothetical protein
MFTNYQPTNQPLWLKIIGSTLLMLVLLAMPRASNASTGAQALRGELAKGYSSYYLQVQPPAQDGIVTLTLTLDPQDKRRVASRVNILLLTPDGLRKVQAGDKPENVAIATGNPNVLDADADSKALYTKVASFKSSGRELYTVVIFSRALVPVVYTLTADNALLVDSGGELQAVE